MKLAELKAKFDLEVNESCIKYDWDAGWCYSYIEHPLMEVQVDGTEEQAIEWEQYTYDWLYTHDEVLYHMSDVVEGKLVNQANTLESEEAKEYAQGLIGYIKKSIERFPELNSFYSPKVEELERFVAGFEFESKVLEE